MYTDLEGRQATLDSDTAQRFRRSSRRVSDDVHRASPPHSRCRPRDSWRCDVQHCKLVINRTPRPILHAHLATLIYTVNHKKRDITSHHITSHGEDGSMASRASISEK